MREYYDARAPEYDEWYLDQGQYAARDRIPQGHFVPGDALHLPFKDGSFDRVFTGHFYGHLEEWQTRVLNDGSRYQVYKRYFDADELAAELGGGTVLHSGDWFVIVATGDEVASSR